MFVNGGENLVNEEKGLSIQGRVIQGWQGKSRYTILQLIVLCSVKKIKLFSNIMQ
jgi:hypothetical protein